MMCSQCGQEHALDDLELAFHRPDIIAAMDAGQREETVQDHDDVCTIKWSQYFVRAVLPLPVEGRETPYAIGLWVEVDELAVRRILDLWSAPDQAGEAPFDGRLANSIPTLPETRGLPVKLRLTGPTTRPEAELVPQGHPLALEQSRGISAHRAHEYSLLSASAASRFWRHALEQPLSRLARPFRKRRRT